jgi:hypothetical protein
MKLRQPSSRWALWVFAAALLLKSAMPWLATASAEWQGKALVEVCTVYGVALVPSGTDAPAPAPDHPAGHANAECALTALSVLAQFDPPVIAPMPAARHPAASPRSHAASQAPDACATWVARLKHGPPPTA